MTRRGFTLVELLVVIAVVSLLLTVLVPALTSARRAAGMTVELAGARTLMQGYTRYTTDNDSRTLPGFMDPGKLKDDLGRDITFSEVRKRYPWRLLPYLDHGLVGSVLIGPQAELLSARNGEEIVGQPEFDFYYNISLMPSLGYNSRYVGGDPRSGPESIWKPVKLVTRADAPSSLITFSSARNNVAPETPSGYFFVAPPTTDTFDPTLPPQLFGFNDPRWSGRSVTAFLDGHADSLSESELATDNRLWANEARRTNDPEWLYGEP